MRPCIGTPRRPSCVPWQRPTGRSAPDARLLPVLQERGEVLLTVGRWEEADATLAQALRLAEALGDRRAVAQVQTALGRLAWWQGQLDDATAWLELAVATFGELGDAEGLGEAYQELGTVKVQQGDRAAGRVLYRAEPGDPARYGGQAWATARLSNNMGIIEFTPGQFRVPPNRIIGRAWKSAESWAISGWSRSPSSISGN